jgi:uncharacterized protein (DUF736 family)
MQIGSFFRTANGYEGIIETATLDIRISIIPADPADADKAPDWRIYRGDGGDGPEIGAGWNETGERAGDYVSLRIDDPAFAQPIRAALFQNANDKSAWSLRWNRQPKSREQD